MLLQKDPNSTLNNTLKIDTNYLLNPKKIKWFTKIIYDSPNRHSREECIDLGIKCVIFLDIPNHLKNKTGLIQQYQVTEKESFCNEKKRILLLHVIYFLSHHSKYIILGFGPKLQSTKTIWD